MESTIQLRRLMVELAKAEVGTPEVGNNSGKRVREYQAATSLKGTGWPWCAAFCCFIIRQWGTLPEVAAELRRQHGFTDWEKWRPRTAAAFGFEEWAEAHGCQVLTRKAPLRSGDLMIFSTSHIGIVDTDDDKETIWTVEGNTGKAGGRDGDGVYAKRRRRAEARSFVRIMA